MRGGGVGGQRPWLGWGRLTQSLWLSQRLCPGLGIAVSSSVGPCGWGLSAKNRAEGAITLFKMGAGVVPSLPSDLHGGLVHVGVCRKGLSVRKEVSGKPGSGDPWS